MTIRITQDMPMQQTAGSLVFQAEDGGGLFELWVPGLLWEQLQAEAPLPGDADDRRDYALSALEATAAKGEPTVVPGGLRQLRLS